MRRPLPSLKKIAAGGLLALAFLFAQQTAALHWLSHAIEATQAKTGQAKVPTDHCDECLTLSALGAAAASSAVSLPAAVAHPAQQAAVPDTPSPAALRLAFHSRAPPVLS